MGDFKHLSKTLEHLEYERGFRDGYLIELRRLAFLRSTKIGNMSSRIWGWLVRKEYKKLFDQA